MAKLLNLQPGTTFVLLGGNNHPDQYGELLKVNECRARVKWQDGKEGDVTPGLGVKLIPKSEWPQPVKAKEEDEKPKRQATADPAKKRKGAELSELGSNVLSQAGQIDACYTDKPITLDQLHKKLGFNKSRIKAHCANRIQKGLIVETDNGYVRVDGAKTTKTSSKKKSKTNAPKATTSKPKKTRKPTAKKETVPASSAPLPF